MKHSQTPQQHKPTLIRRCLTFAEHARYHLEYRRRLKALKRQGLVGRFSRLSRNESRSIRRFWSRHGVGWINLDWYRLFKTLVGEADPRFIPEEVFRVVLEPALCRRDVAMAYHDKNRLDSLFPDVPKPKTLLRNIYGRYFDGDYTRIDPVQAQRLLTQEDSCILKPAISGTGSGSNVALLYVDHGRALIEGSPCDLASIERIYVQDFLVQRCIRQHASLAVFHSQSLNTVRIITYRFQGEIYVLAATFRMGNGSYVDNGHAGGLLCGVNTETGELTSFAYDVSFRKYDQHPLSGIAFRHQAVFRFDRMKRLALGLHDRLNYFDVLSFDVCLLEDGSPCLIEINTFGQGVEPHQMLKGQPLFGTLTDAVLELVAHRRRIGWNSP
jgi:hypothetical protein